MLIYGAGGHSKVIIDTIEYSGGKTEGVFDDFTDGKILDVPNLGAYNPDKLSHHKLVVGIGNNQLRHKIVTKVRHEFGKVVHANSFISNYTIIGKGSVVFVSAVVQSACKIGDHVIVNTGAQIDHDCLISDFSHVGPGAVLCGGIKLGMGVFVGAGATIIPGVKVGDWAIVGAGAVVTKDVPAGSCVGGVPAKNLKSE